MVSARTLNLMLICLSRYFFKCTFVFCRSKNPQHVFQKFIFDLPNQSTASTRKERCDPHQKSQMKPIESLPEFSSDAHISFDVQCENAFRCRPTLCAQIRTALDHRRDRWKHRDKPASLSDCYVVQQETMHYVATSMSWASLFEVEMLIVSFGHVTLPLSRKKNLNVT